MTPAGSETRRAQLEIRGNLREFFTMKDRTEIILDGPAGCISGETRIFDPVIGESIEVSELEAQQKAPTVLTMVGAVKAHIPFLKGVAPIFRVTTHRGYSILTTSDHLFYSANGWVKCASLVNGCPILISDTSYLESYQDAHYLKKTALNSLDDCPKASCSYGVQPHVSVKDDQLAAPLLNDAHEHTRGNSPQGDLAGVLEHILTCLEYFRISKRDYYDQTAQTVLKKYHSFLKTLVSGYGTFRQYEQSQLVAYLTGLIPLLDQDRGYTLPCKDLEGSNPYVLTDGVFAALCTQPHLLSEELESSLHIAPKSFSFDYQTSVLCLSLSNLPNCHYTVQWDEVASVEYVRTDKYYDLHVPGANHYLAQGLWNHNTGKTRVALERQHLVSTKYPNSRGLILRKYRSSMNETCLQVLDKEVFADRNGKPYQDAPHWAERDQKYIYDNGTEIIVAGMDDPTKVMSSQYDWFYWNEAIEAQQSEWEAVMSRLRNGRIPYQQALGDTNPGPPGHWILQREKDGRLTRLPTNHKDNPVYWNERKQKWTTKGEAYVNNILRDSLTGVVHDRLYKGLWVSAEGLVYDMFDPNVHVIARRPLPRHWPRYWVVDFGYVDPFVWIELVENPETGEIYLTKELYHTNMRVDEAAEYIKEATQGTIPWAIICDHDAEDRATLEKCLGMMTVPAFKAINIGIQYVQRRLRADDPRYLSARGFYVFHDCGIKIDKKLKDRHKPTSTVDEFPLYQWDTGKIALDKYKDAPIDKNNHGMDVVRYGICFIDDASIDPQEFVRHEAYNDIDSDDDELGFGYDGWISSY